MSGEMPREPGYYFATPIGHERMYRGPVRVYRDFKSKCLLVERIGSNERVMLDWYTDYAKAIDPLAKEEQL